MVATRGSSVLYSIVEAQSRSRGTEWGIFTRNPISSPEQWLRGAAKNGRAAGR